MKTFRLFSMAALALMMAACSSEDNALETASPAMPGKLQFTATIAAPSGATTRTVYTEVTESTDPDYNKIKVAWKENDEIAAIVMNSEGKLVKNVLTVSEVNNTDGSATITGDITKPKDDAQKVDLIYPADIVTVADDGSDYLISFKKMSNGTLDGTLESIANNIDYRMADDCALTVSGDKATLTSAAKLESKLSIWKLTLKKEDNSSLSASKVAIGDGTGVMASATLASAASEVYLPVLVDAMSADIVISATEGSDNYYYLKKNVTLAAKKYYRSTVQMTKGAHLAFLSADYIAKDGETLTGALAADATTKIKIADNAIVTLKDVTINGTNVDDIAYKHAGITCDGDATIKLEGTNTVKGFHEKSPGISVPDGNTLTIQGTGSLTASSNGKAAGIGGGYATSCGNITISGGTVIATGGYGCAGIGSGYQSYSCGNITISGGTVNATGGELAAGIGSGYWNDVSGTINITSGVTKVTATKGTNAPNSIGKGDSSPDISVTIGGTVYASGITTSPYEYSAPAYTLLSAATTSDYGKVVCAAGHLHDAKTAVPSGCTAVGILGKVTATGKGLILALKDATAQTWNTINGWTSVNTYAGTTLKVLPDDAARGANLTSYTALGTTAVSNWAVAQKSDYEAIFTNLGSMKSETYGTTYDDNVNAYITTGVGGTELSSGYFSATEHEDLPGFGAWAFTSGYWQSQMQTVSYSVRPVLGF